MYRLFVLWIGKLTLTASRLMGRGSGAALPGLIAEKLMPSFIARSAQGLKYGAVLVTGTNGKTTTTKLMAGILEKSGHRLVVNRSGSNLSRGIASAIIENSSWSGELRGDLGLFEVDEAFMGDVAAKLHPKIVVVLNLLRDQLDRYGELDRTAQLIGSGLQYTASAVLNADDPMVAALGQYVPSGKIVYFGALQKLKAKLPHDEELLKRRQHPRLAKKVERMVSELNLLLTKAEPATDEQELELVYQGQTYAFKIELAGVYNAYNALAALAAVTLLDRVNFKKATLAIGKVPPAFGRTELVEIDGKKVQLILSKNPAAFNQTITTFLASGKNLPLLIAINDNFADGRDVSWLWDVDFEKLTSHGPRVITTGSRGYDLAVRLKYAGIESLHEESLSHALEQFLDQLTAGEHGYIVPTYTAMLALRGLLAKKTKLAKEWE